MLTVMLTILMYWVLMGVGVAVTMALFYGLALVLGELAEWLRQQFAKLSLRKWRIGSNPILSAI